MKKGSLSFTFAARFFPRRTRANVAKLYAWCRYADDLVDGKTNDLAETRRRLAELEAESLGQLPPSRLATQAFQEVRVGADLSSRDVKELLAGMAMDCRQVRLRDEEELDLYCHRVAGVVGLMMCKVMGVSDARALRHADDLGKAMQLTNICRDVADDRGSGRVYIPETLLLRHGILDPLRLMEPSCRASLVAAVHELLGRADELYRSGDEGLVYLPFRASVAVGAARAIYSAIGDEIVRRGANAWETRVWIPGWKKILLAAKGSLGAFATVPQRVRRAREPVLQGL